MIKIISHGKEKEIHKNDYVKVSELIRDTGFPMPCQGKGTCLKCKVILKGEISGLSDKEMSALSHEEMKKGIRLACVSKIKSGEIIIPDNFVKNVTELKNAEELNGCDNYIISVDIGTTVITGYLYNPYKKEIEKEISELNKLSSFGLDVMSRIEYAIRNSVKEMSEILKNQVNSIIDLLCKENVKTAITGNTVMLNILSGNDISSMGVYPYTAPDMFGRYVNTGRREVYIPKCIDSFAGADLLCGIIASDMNEDDSAILIDIGTNGEIALKWKDEKICTSSPAGPAFEGAGIKKGMGAVCGAVSSVFAQGTNLRYKTIGNKTASGICGSGIIDLIAELKRYNAIDGYGNIIKEGHPFSHLVTEEENETRIYLSDCDVYITDKDIRNIQLAKSAVRSAINTLLYSKGIKADEIKKVYIAGSFGNFINIKNACYTGMLPKEFENKVILSGNLAGKGALLTLINKEREKEAEDYIYTDLSKSEYFSNEFIKNTGI